MMERRWGGWGGWGTTSYHSRSIAKLGLLMGVMKQIIDIIEGNVYFQETGYN